MWAACDLLLQLQHADNDAMRSSPRTKVAVGAASYHGPGFSSYGAIEPLGLIKSKDACDHNAIGPKQNQLKYPVPSCLERRKDEPEEEFNNRIMRDIDAFFDQHAHEIGVLLVEPQWGSSLAAQVAICVTPNGPSHPCSHGLGM